MDSDPLKSRTERVDPSLVRLTFPVVSLDFIVLPPALTMLVSLYCAEYGIHWSAEIPTEGNVIAARSQINNQVESVHNETPLKLFLSRGTVAYWTLEISVITAPNEKNPSSQ